MLSRRKPKHCESWHKCVKHTIFALFDMFLATVLECFAEGSRNIVNPGINVSNVSHNIRYFLATVLECPVSYVLSHCLEMLCRKKLKHCESWHKCVKHNIRYLPYLICSHPLYWNALQKEAETL